MSIEGLSLVDLAILGTNNFNVNVLTLIRNCNSVLLIEIILGMPVYIDFGLHTAC